MLCRGPPCSVCCKGAPCSLCCRGPPWLGMCRSLCMHAAHGWRCSPGHTGKHTGKHMGKHIRKHLGKHLEKGQLMSPQQQHSNTAPQHIPCHHMLTTTTIFGNSHGMTIHSMGHPPHCPTNTLLYSATFRKQSPTSGNRPMSSCAQAYVIVCIGLCHCVNRLTR